MGNMVVVPFLTMSHPADQKVVPNQRFLTHSHTMTPFEKAF